MPQVDQWLSRLIASLAAGLFGLISTACTPVETSRPVPDQPQTSLQQVVLKRIDHRGRLLWQLQADKVVMSDPQGVHLRQIRGTFYQNREAIYTLQAPQGQVYQHSNFIQLQGPIVVKDVRDRSTLHSQYIQWHPQSGQLIAQPDVRLDHPDFNLQGQRLQASTRTHQAQITGQVVVKVPEQGLHLKAQHMTWLPRQSKVQAHSSTQATVKLSSSHTPPAIAWQQAQAQQVDLDLRSKQLILRQSVQMNFTQPHIQLSSSKVIGDLVRQQWHSPQGIQIQYQGITATADQGWLDPSPTLRLQNQVQVKGLPRQARLRTQKLTWNLATQDLKAQGNLVYQQPEPWIKLTGTRALGNLRRQTLEVQGGEAVAEILP